MSSLVFDNLSTKFYPVSGCHKTLFDCISPQIIYYQLINIWF